MISELKVNKELTDYLNKELVPIFKEATHKYFGENFLDGFSWKSKEREFLGAIKRKKKFNFLSYSIYNRYNYIGSILANKKSGVKVELGEKLFQNKKITGNGVYTFFHEIAHCWLNYKFEGEFDNFRNSGNRVQYNVAEGFCDFASCNIIKRTNIRHLFPDSLKYAEKLENCYSYLTNQIKYAPNQIQFFTHEDIFKKERKKFSINFLFPNWSEGDEKYLYYFNRPVRAKVFSILTCYDNLKQIKGDFLENPPRTMQELNNYIPKLQN